MRHAVQVTVVGDYINGFEPHETLEASVTHAGARLGVTTTVRWVATPDVRAADGCAGGRRLRSGPGSRA
jgi:CTP synthase (UTP-ammonia lyase)